MTQKLWRVVFTDSEAMHGVTPICPQPDVHAELAGRWGEQEETYSECCAAAGLVLECLNEGHAIVVRDALNAAEAEIAS